MRYIAALVILCAIAFAIYRQGGADQARDDRETKLQRSKDISDAIKDVDAAPDWRDQLRNRDK